MALATQGCLAAWSVLTAAGGLAVSGLQLGLARIGVSAVEAGGSPASSSLIADYFPPQGRPLAMAFYSGASTVAVLVSFGAGGLLDAAFGWRWTLAAAGAPGLLLAGILLATVPEPTRGSSDADKGTMPEPPRPAVPLLASLVALWRNLLFRRVVLGAGVANFGFHAVLNWGPSFVIRKFYPDAGQAGAGHVGLFLGAGIGLFGLCAAIVSGRVTGRLIEAGMRRPLRLAAPSFHASRRSSRAFLVSQSGRSRRRIR